MTAPEAPEATIPVLIVALLIGALWLNNYNQERRKECAAKICTAGKRPLRTRDGYCLCFDVPTATSAR